MENVTSSTIKAVGYEGKDLLVQFVSGTVYRYKDVPKKVYEEFLSAESKGKFLNENVKVKYVFQKEEAK